MASKNWYEKTWNPIDVGFNFNKSNSSGGVASTVSNHGWFDDLIRLATNRQQKLDTYDKMDTTLDISRALDILAEDISSENADDDKSFSIDFPDEYDVKSRALVLHTTTLSKWLLATELDYKFFDHARELLKYGMIMFRRTKKKGTWQKIAARDIIGFKLSDEKNTATITHYLIDTGKKKPNGQIDPDMIKIEELSILKLGESPFGESVLDDVHRVWKQYSLLEDALIIYRIVRAPERRVFYISVGDQPTKKAEAALNKIKRGLQQKQMTKSNGDLETVYNPTNIQEDYFIAQDSEGRGSRVETLPGGQSLNQIDELEFFNKRIALGLRIPPSYMDTFSQDRSGQTHNDGRLGTAYIVELRYAGYIKRLQKTISKPLRLDFEKYAAENEIILDNNMIFRIEPPQSFAIYKENELNVALLNVYSTAENIETLSKRFALMKYLNLTQTELEENENKKIEEMGLDPKKLTPEQILNAVYGDKSLLPGNDTETGSDEEQDEFQI